MNWLNLELSFLHAPEYIGSDPTERATWLNLLGYCAEQENGGVIRNCLGWKSRQWEQSCGVTAEEIAKNCELWRKKRNSIFVWNYPVAKEAEVQAKRDGGRKGGKTSGRLRYKLSAEAPSEPKPGAILEAELEAELQRKGMEGNGMEEKSELALTLPEPNGHFREFTDRWCAEYLTAFGGPYKFQKAKDGKAVKSLLETGESVDVLIGLVVSAWKQRGKKDKWNCNCVTDIAKFASCINGIRAELKSPTCL